MSDENPKVNDEKLKLSGGYRLKASGKHPVLLGLTPEDHALLQQAAAVERRPLTQFLVYHGIVAARRVIAESKSSGLFPP